jgi:hypothetical protein
VKRSIQFGIALCSAAAVVLAAVVDTQRTSPGPLTSVHGREPDLQGSSNCSSCHGGWFSSMTDSCQECHEFITDQIESGEGLHGAVSPSRARQCALCHSEHHGPGFAIVNKQSFALAGVPDASAFDHQLVGFDMQGRHRELECTECHENALAPVLEAGARRFVGLDQSCVTCHEDVHEGEFVLSCTACHGQQTWDELHSVGHERHLPLVGGHAAVSCRSCHDQDDPHSLEALGGAKDSPPTRECADCHESPHDLAFVRGAAELADVQPGASCAVCHLAEHTSFRESDVAVDREQHARSGFPLDPPHDEAACADCHTPDEPLFEARYPGRAPEQCSACHADPHGGQFRTGPFAGAECTACHETQHFEPHAFTVEKHAVASLPLDGAHAKTECNECHLDPMPQTPRVFRGTERLCEDCHEDAHRGFFDPVEATLPAPAAGECSRCHGTASFAGVDRGFEHSAWTGFAVIGAHSQNACESCHPRAEHPDESGRAFGRATEHFGEIDGCVTCHDDVHQGQFDGPGQPRLVQGRSDCARCHVESSFRTFEERFDHALWTGYVLTGPHAELDCSACHTPLRKRDEDGRTWARAKGSECADCHQDPHAGQFTVGDAVDCARCHVEDRPRYLVFDHDRDSRFPLSEAHERVACSACHQTQLVAGRDVVHYRPLGMECVDCHGVSEDVLLRRKPRKK